MWATADGLLWIYCVICTGSAGYKRGEELTRPAPTPIGDDHEWLKKSLRRATDNAYHLYDSEISFVDGLKAKLDRFDEGTYVSPKQRAWLERIMKRLDRMGVGADEDDPDDPVARPVDEVIR